jgi:hypothetical protein
MAKKPYSRAYRKGVYTAHLRRIEQYTASLELLYDKVNADLCRLAVQSGYMGDGMFRFSDYPELNNKAKAVIEGFRKELRSLITDGTVQEWRACNADNDVLVSGFLNAVRFKGSFEKAFPKYYQNNEAALQAFLKRKTDHLSLSDRIWKLGDVHKQNLEDAISIALKKGTSAAGLSREVRKELQEPDKLFRRVRNKRTGLLGLSKPAKEYRPEPGAYRSSFKNAMRLTRTVINNSYREAEQERWKQLDFITGYEVKRTRYRPFDCPLCDSLAGIYPKNFVFIGWHPQCLCYTIPILCSDEEFWNSMETDTPIRESVTEVPKGYKDWISSHRDQIMAAEKRGTLPWFLKDNDYKSFL